MIRSLFAKHIGFPLQDLLTQTHILPVLKVLKKSQYWSEEALNEYRLIKLQSLLIHSYKNVPYYTDLFNQYGISPYSVKSFDDIRKIPILTKELVRANRQKLIACNSNSKHIKISKTGGTTGSPLVFYSDADNRSFTWASYYRWYSWIGINKEDKVLTLWGARNVLEQNFRNALKEKIINLIQNKETINTFEINDLTFPDVYKKIIDYDPVLIKGYLSSLLLLARFMQKNNLPSNTGLKALSSTTETLFPASRDFLQRVFSVPVFDQYGCGEIPAISYECSHHKGLHINEEHVFIESLDENGNCVFNAKGRLILTSLDNYVMPFIRYENGDDATILTNKCSCGVNSQLMSSPEGRTVDTITLRNGNKVHGVFFTDLLFELGITTDIISRFQVVQHENGAVDFKLEADKDISPDMLKKIESATIRFIDSVKVIPMGSIPNEPNGKFRYIKQEFYREN